MLYVRKIKKKIEKKQKDLDHKVNKKKIKDRR